MQIKQPRQPKRLALVLVIIVSLTLFIAILLRGPGADSTTHAAATANKPVVQKADAPPSTASQPTSKVTTNRPTDRRAVLFGLEPYDDAEVLEVFKQYMGRIRNFDETLSSQELLEFEQRLTLSVEFSEHAADLMQHELETALFSIDAPQLYLLERVFGGGDDSPKRLIDVYLKAVESDRFDIEDYALQGIENYKEHTTVEQRHLALEEAFKQVDRYRGSDKILPAVGAIMNISTLPGVSHLYKTSGSNMLLSALHSNADSKQKFFLQKALYRLESDERAFELAGDLLQTDPSKHTVLAVMEAVTMKDFQRSEALDNKIRLALNRADVSQEELKLATEIGVLTEQG